jgi:putative transposase
MKKSRYTELQIVNILKQNKSGITVAELCREYSMSQVTLLQTMLLH